MKQSICDRYETTFLQERMMGPNAMRIAEEMAGHLPLRPDMRILDLGCGRGLSSIVLAEQSGGQVIAADLWIAPEENAKTFQMQGMQQQILPVSLDATKEIPFAEQYFDVLFSVDSYHYFGANKEMLPKLKRYVKPGGYLAVAVPGLKQPFSDGVPEEMQPYWQEDIHFHTCDWWRMLWEKEPGVTIVSSREMDCNAAAWKDWLTCDNPYAVQDIDMMEAEGGKYFNLVQMIAMCQ